MVVQISLLTPVLSWRHRTAPMGPQRLPQQSGHAVSPSRLEHRFPLHGKTSHPHVTLAMELALMQPLPSPPPGCGNPLVPRGPLQPRHRAGGPRSRGETGYGVLLQHPRMAPSTDYIRPLEY